MFLYEDSEYETTTKSLKLGPPNQKAENTIKHLAKGWLPINTILLNSVKESIRDKSDIKRDLLIASVKKDPGLFLYAARSLKHVSPDVRGQHDPIAELRVLEYEKLNTLFDVRSTQISVHNFKDASRLQALRLQHSLVSLTMTEKLAAQTQVPTDRAFMVCSFYELGLNLIAWNYPHIYSRYMARLRSNITEANAELRNVLGLSAIDIGSRFASNCEAHPEVRSTLAALSVGHAPTLDTPLKTQSLSQALVKIVQISDLYAQVKDHVHYPKALSTWAALDHKLTDSFPPHVLGEVDAQVIQALSTYTAFSDVIASLPLATSKTHSIEALAPSLTEPELLTSNPHLLKCSEQVRKTFASVYSHIERDKFSLNAVRVLADEAIPALGFVRGCLFFLSADNRTLTPALRIGDRLLAEYHDFFSDPDRGVVVSPFNSTPFKSHGIGICGKSTSQVAGAIDSTRYFGILYLEVSEEATLDPSHNPTLLFKAIRKAINDAFG